MQNQAKELAAGEEIVDEKALDMKENPRYGGTSFSGVLQLFNRFIPHPTALHLSYGAYHFLILCVFGSI